MAIDTSRRGDASLPDYGDARSPDYGDASSPDYGDAPSPDYRDYDNAEAGVRNFYLENHRQQTLEFARAKRAQFGKRTMRTMGVWEACEFLDTLVDDSDPDTRLSQMEHCLQTAEGIRRDNHPDWFVLAGLVHDLGKALCLYGEPQWAVTGDTFALGCAFNDAIVYPEYFADNPDASNPDFDSPCGIYDAGCGLDNVTLSWGHDEYMYLVARDFLPEPALYMIRYHSFYPGHSTDAYAHLFDDHDRDMFRWVQAFNAYDLYTKHDDPPDSQALLPYYEQLIAKYFPPEIAW